MTSSIEKRMGRPPVHIAPEIMEELIEIKVTEQLPWKKMDLIYQDITGQTIDWRTLRNAMLRDGGQQLISERADRKTRERLDSLNESVDMLQLILLAFKLKFNEFLKLSNKMDLAEIDEDTKFTIEDSRRMDIIWHQMEGFFFKAGTWMKDMQVDTKILAETFMRVLTVQTTTVTVEGEEALSQEDMGAFIAELTDQTQRKLEQVNQSHRTEARGHWRALPDLEEDLLEEDA